MDVGIISESLGSRKEGDESYGQSTNSANYGTSE
jgi:hypothetical protein